MGEVGQKVQTSCYKSSQGNVMYSMVTTVNDKEVFESQLSHSVALGLTWNR